MTSPGPDPGHGPEADPLDLPGGREDLPGLRPSHGIFEGAAAVQRCSPMNLIQGRLLTFEDTFFRYPCSEKFRSFRDTLVMIRRQAGETKGRHDWCHHLWPQRMSMQTVRASTRTWRGDVLDHGKGWFEVKDPCRLAADAEVSWFGVYPDALITGEDLKPPWSVAEPKALVSGADL